MARILDGKAAAAEVRSEVAETVAVSATFDSNVGSVSWGSGQTASTDSTTAQDRVASFSQRSTTLTDIFAPGAMITGGHADDGADVLYDGAGKLRIGGPRYPEGASHGSGCTHSSALAAYLARGAEVAEAARWAREIASEAVGNGLAQLGEGPGPVDALGIIRR